MINITVIVTTIILDKGANTICPLHLPAAEARATGTLNR
jgi:hypothetical protein